MSSHRSQVDLRKLKRNGVIVAEALARYMYNLSDKVIKWTEWAQMKKGSSFAIFLN